MYNTVWKKLLDIGDIIGIKGFAFITQTGQLSVHAKELTVLPGRTATIRDRAAYGMIMMQGHGKMAAWDVETPTMIRFGQLTHDEFFVSEAAATAGVRITNPSPSDPLVILKHFGPENPGLPTT